MDKEIIKLCITCISSKNNDFSHCYKCIGPKDMSGWKSRTNNELEEWKSFLNKYNIKFREDDNGLSIKLNEGSVEAAGVDYFDICFNDNKYNGISIDG